MGVPLPSPLRDLAANFPETSYGATRVLLELPHNRVVPGVVLGWGCEIVRIGARTVSAECDLDFDTAEIVNVLPDPDGFDAIIHLDERDQCIARLLRPMAKIDAVRVARTARTSSEHDGTHIGSVTPAVACLVADMFGNWDIPVGVYYMNKPGVYFAGVGYLDPPSSQPERPASPNRYFHRLPVGFPEVLLECQPSLTTWESGTYPVRRVLKTYTAKIRFAVELPSILPPGNCATRHVVECPVCGNLVSFDIIPAGYDDQRRKRTVRSFFRKRNVDKPECFLAQGEEYEGLGRYFDNITWLRETGRLSELDFTMNRLVGDYNYRDSRTRYFHSAVSLQM